jgi:hypothetical protein
MKKRPTKYEEEQAAAAAAAESALAKLNKRVGRTGLGDSGRRLSAVVTRGWKRGRGEQGDRKWKMQHCSGDGCDG